MPTHVVMGSGCRFRLPEIMSRHQWSRLLVVVDPHLTGLCWFGDLRRLLSDEGIQLAFFSDFSANPRTSEAERAAEAAWSTSADAVLAIGGGSAIDAAKAAAMLATNQGKALDFVGLDLFPASPLPLLALPTTCGTGSEVTWVSVLTEETRREKVSIKGGGMFPAYALVDPDLLATLPPHLIASTAMDAMTHAVEALVGRCANPISDAMARQAVALIFEHLETLVRSEGSDETARFYIAKASCLAGMAFGNADVAGVHCLSESIGALFDAPHGVVNAILLAPTLRYQQAYLGHRLHKTAQVIGCNVADEACNDAFLEAVEGLVARLKIPAFASLHIPTDAYETIAGLAERNGSNASNPRPMAAADYLAVLNGLTVSS
nr:iron-containing alcohol dehydrogenase [Acanthopleuribacter pedis]